MGVLGGAFRYGALLNGWKGAGLGEVGWVDLPSKGGFFERGSGTERRIEVGEVGWFATPSIAFEGTAGTNVSSMAR